MASSYDCCTCGCPCNYQAGSLYIKPNSAAVVVGGTAQLLAYGNFLDCNNCWCPYLAGGSTWSSAPTSVATVSTGGLVTGQSAGTAYIEVDYTGCTNWGPGIASPSSTISSSGTCVCNSSVADIAFAPVTVVPAPARLVFHDYSPCAPGGVGPLQIITNGNVVDCGGNVRQTGFCGVNRNVVYQLLDKSGAAFPLAYVIQEHFSNFSTTNTGLKQPNARSANIAAGALVGDYQYAGFYYPTCLGSNDHSSYTQTWTVTVGGNPYNLSTVMSISLGRFSGTYQDNVSITTP